jgi:hypothetical protein
MRWLGKLLLSLMVSLLIPWPAPAQMPLPASTRDIDFDPYVIDRAEIRAELRLDAEQASTLNELRRQADIGVALAATGKAVDQAAIDKINIRLVETQRAVLRPEQLKRLEELQIQSWGVWALNDPAIQKKLGLNAGQRSKINKIKSIVKRAIAPSTDSTIDEAIVGSERRAMEAALALLTADQRRIWKGMVGEPFAPGPPPPLVLAPILPPAPALNLPNLETMRFPEDFVSESMNITMVNDPLVQADLKLDARQVQAARAIATRFSAPFRENAAALQVLTPSEKRAKIRELAASQSKALKPEIERLLTPEQSRRADQILRWQALPLALVSPGVQRRFKLDETQTQAAVALSEEYLRASLTAMQEDKRGAALLAVGESKRREITSKFIRLLKPEQKPLWDAMMGAPYAMSDAPSP